MRKGLLLVLAVLLVSISGCLNQDKPAPGANRTLNNSNAFANTLDKFPPLGMAEVMRNVFDDRQSALVIKIDEPKYHGSDSAMDEIINKKRAWEQMFRNKDIATMTIYSSEVWVNRPGFGDVQSTEIVGFFADYRTFDRDVR